MAMPPSCPRRRSSSAARSPAREAPTMTIWSRPTGAGPNASSALDRDGLLRAAPRGLFDLGAELLGRLVLEHVQEVVVPDLEHLGSGRHAQGVALAQVVVDDDSHVRSPHGTGSEGLP